MKWQKRLRVAIAIFVVVFAAVVVVSPRRGHSTQTPAPEVKKRDDKAVTEGGVGDITNSEKGKVTFSLKFGNQLTYEDGRSKLGGGVTVVLPDKNGRSITIVSQ